MRACPMCVRFSQDACMLDVCTMFTRCVHASRRQLVPFFGQSPFRTFRQIFQRRFVVNTFVEMFEMEIVQKKGTSCRRLEVSERHDVSVENTMIDPKTQHDRSIEVSVENNMIAQADVSCREHSMNNTDDVSVEITTRLINKQPSATSPAVGN